MPFEFCTLTSPQLFTRNREIMRARKRTGIVYLSNNKETKIDVPLDSRKRCQVHRRLLPTPKNEGSANMNVISQDIGLTEIFSSVFEDLLTRRVSDDSLVYQSFGTVWNIAFRGQPHSVNIGETYRQGRYFAYMQPRKPYSVGVPVAQKLIALPNEPAKLSYLAMYYLLAFKGPVDLPALNAKYPEFNRRDLNELSISITYIDAYIRL